MKKKGQIWIETVLYTFIAIVLIGLALAFITPRITDMKDKAAVEQTISTLNVLDERVNAVFSAPGNRRKVDILLKRGEMYIDLERDAITIEIKDLRKPYSEPGAVIKEGRVSINSTKGQKTSSVELGLNYTGLADITYKDMGPDEIKKFNPSATSYSLAIENKGVDEISGKFIVMIEEVSGK